MLSALALAACGKKPDEAKVVAPGTPVTVTQAVTRIIELREETVGSLESLADPQISAEVQGKVLRVRVVVGSEVKAGQELAELDTQDVSLTRRSAQSDVQRLEALTANQVKHLEQLKQLRQQNFISQAALDDAAAQTSATQDQLAGARAQLALAQHNVAKTSVVSPVDGRVEKQMVSPGQFVKIGDPMFQVVTAKKLRARLPFPESMTDEIRRGMAVRLSSPSTPDKLQGKIDEIRPMAGSSNRAFDAYITFENTGAWKPGATVNGTIVLGEHRNAVVVPEQSVVLRPAGEVVYVVQGNKVAQRMVQAGARQDGMVEILGGLKEGESVAVDGANFLTDQAAITVSAAKPVQAK
jgi:RND family efflux transporter MFP subunit